MSHPSTDEVLVLQALRTRGCIDTPTVAAVTGLDLQRVTDLLAGFEEAGWVRRQEGRLVGWVLKPEGRVEGQRRLQAELEAAGERATVEDAYERFVAANPELLAICTEWQARPVGRARVPNDHSDPEHDDAVLRRLRALDVEAQAICALLASALARFSPYGERLANALDKVRGGALDWLTSPSVESYHEVWFELHEDLLATLGLDRADEAAKGSV